MKKFDKENLTEEDKKKIEEELLQIDEELKPAMEELKPMMEKFISERKQRQKEQSDEQQNEELGIEKIKEYMTFLKSPIKEGELYSRILFFETICEASKDNEVISHLIMDPDNFDIVKIGYELLMLSKDDLLISKLIESINILMSEPQAIVDLISNSFMLQKMLTLLQESENDQIKNELISFVAILSAAKESIEALKTQGIILILFKFLLDPNNFQKQEILFNGSIAFLRLNCFSEDENNHIPDKQTIHLLCSVIAAFGSDKYLLQNAIITYFTSICNSRAIALQISEEAVFPSILKILNNWLQIFEQQTSSKRKFFRITKTNADKNLNASMDILDQNNPIYQGSKPEDIIIFLRLLSLQPELRKPISDAGFIPPLASIINNNFISWDYKIQATNFLTNLSQDPSIKTEIVKSSVQNVLIRYLSDRPMEKQEIVFQNHAIGLLAHISSQSDVIKVLNNANLLMNIICRAPNLNDPLARASVGFMLLNLLKSDDAYKIQEIIEKSASIMSSIQKMVQKETELNEGNIWYKVYTHL